MSRTISFAASWRPVLLAAGAVLLLPACGGGGPGDDVAESLGCTVANCKESPDVATADIVGFYQLWQEGNRVSVQADLSDRRSVISTVRLVSPDGLSLTSGGQTRVIPPTDDTRMSYATSLDGQGPSPTVFVDFVRAGQSYRSSVTMPAPFTIVSPAGSASALLSTGELQVELSVPSTEVVLPVVDGACTRADGTGVNLGNVAILSVQVESTASGSRYHVDLPQFDSALNAASTGNGTQPTTAARKVATCDLRLTWERSATGTPAPGMASNGVIIGKTLARMLLSYDATR